jgi:hypothetical protein
MVDNQHYKSTRRRLWQYENPRHSQALLDKMATRAEVYPSYGARFKNWLDNGSTLELRRLTAPFGDFVKDLWFFNLVDAIDSAHLHPLDPVR